MRRWLVGAVRAGRVDRGAVLVHGDILPTERRTRSSALWFDLRDARVAFAEQWPTASSVHGRVVAEVDGVRGRLTEARLAGIRADATELALLPLPSGGRELRVDGAARGDGAALLEFLRRAPLGETLDFLDSEWAASGPVDLSWLLRLPLGQPVRRLEVDADLALSGLRIPQGRLDLADLRGRIGYRHPGRLVADELEGRLFGGELRASMDGALGSGSEGLVIDLDGSLLGRNVADWLRRPGALGTGRHGGLQRSRRARRERRRPPRSGGRSPAADDRAARAAGRTGSTVVDPHGDRQGCPGRREPGLGRDRRPLPAGGRSSGAGSAGPGYRPGELPAIGLSIRGETEHLDVGAWLEAIRRMEDDALVGGEGGSSVSTLLELDLEVARAGWGQLEFGATGLRLDGSPRAFRIDFDSRRVEGRVRRFEGDRPMELILDRLQLPLAGLETPAPTGEEAPDRPSLVERLTADLDTVDLPDMDVTIRSFSLDGEDLGRAAFELRPDPDGLRLESIDAAGRGLVFEPDDQGRARIDMRLVPGPATRVAGRLSGDDAVSVLKRWGYAPTVEADRFAFDVDLSWPGPLDRPDPLSLAGTAGAGRGARTVRPDRVRDWAAAGRRPVQLRRPRPAPALRLHRSLSQGHRLRADPGDPGVRRGDARDSRAGPDRGTLQQLRAVHRPGPGEHAARRGADRHPAGELQSALVRGLRRTGGEPARRCRGVRRGTTVPGSDRAGLQCPLPHLRARGPAGGHL
ncbi:MAG: DUF3971 domain-containing protein [Gammaproteobacteria bacterium]|nr:DUF3971 domain-containing protein [Gammaproteobacteria bacterium]